MKDVEVTNHLWRVEVLQQYSSTLEWLDTDTDLQQRGIVRLCHDKASFKLCRNRARGEKMVDTHVLCIHCTSLLS